MKPVNKVLFIPLFFLCYNFSFSQSINKTIVSAEKARWEKHVAQTKIIRDEWGIPHIYGKTDADAVFGLMYAQCEENFSQIEDNYLEMLGRTSEVEYVWLTQKQ